jgi:hypothetical protein
LARYEGRKPLPSCEVDRELLSSIEAYLLDKWSKLDPDVKTEYQFSITDSTGTEHMTCVADYKPHLFPDDTRAVSLWLRSKYSWIKVNFDIELFGSFVSVTIDRPDAREASRGFLESVMDLVKPHSLFINGFLNPSSVSGFAALFAAGLGMVIMIGMFINKLTNDPRVAPMAVFSFMLFILPALYVVASKLRPYIVFDTRLNQRRRRTWRLLVGTIILGLTLGTVSSLLAGYLKKFF